MEKILIIKTHAIGDVLMATPAVRELRKAKPEATIHLLTGKWSASVIRNNPHIDEIIEFDDTIFFRKKIFKLISLIVKIRKRKFNTVLIFHPSPFIHFFALLTGIKRRIGLKRNKRGWFLTDYIDENASSDYYYPLNFLQLLTCIGIQSSNSAIDLFYTDNDKMRAETLLQSHKVEIQDKKILIAAGGSRNPKESIQERLWPKEYYVELIEQIHETYPEHSILLCGAHSDSVTNQFIKGKAEYVKNLTGKTNLTELAWIIKNCSAVVCNDSSILHIALSQEVPVLCFFGPTALKSRIPEHQSHTGIQSRVACSPCYTYAIFPGCQNNLICMHSIKPQEAFNKLCALLK